MLSSMIMNIRRTIYQNNESRNRYKSNINLAGTDSRTICTRTDIRAILSGTYSRAIGTGTDSRPICTGTDIRAIVSGTFSRAIGTGTDSRPIGT